ncbi:MAG: hypothetical protein ACYC7A_20165 [Thermoanaerobaculia bacterium]
MSTPFLFGAGASAFSGACLPRLPPMGSALFDELASRGGIAQQVELDLAAVFRTDFEAGMALFRERHEVLTTGFLLLMAEYFFRGAPIS